MRLTKNMNYMIINSYELTHHCGMFGFWVLIASLIGFSNFSVDKLFAVGTDTDIAFICLILINNNIQLVI